jgi:hypothetical protein
MKRPVLIKWDYEGKTDYSSGTGAYTTEKVLGLSSSFVIPGFLLFHLKETAIAWSIWQILIALLLAFDVSGGLVSNALNSCKRFYHTPPKPIEGKLGIVMKHPVIFSVLHIHPIIASLIYGDQDWSYGLTWYALFLVSVAIVLITPLYLKRPVSMLLIMLSVLVNFYVVEPVPGFEWLMPLLFIKIVYGHLVREEPYRKPHPDPV